MNIPQTIAFARSIGDVPTSSDKSEVFLFGGMRNGEVKTRPVGKAKRASIIS